MRKTTLHWLRPSLVIAGAAALLAGCAEEAPLGPGRRSAPPAQLALVAPTVAGPDLGSCEDLLRVPAKSRAVFHAYAKGVQIYSWDGTSKWLPAGVSAELFADADGKALVGTHYTGPKWKSLSGSTVRGAVRERCFPDANAIAWLLLDATPESGAGVFQRTVFIHRVNTVGGKEPLDAGSYKGELRESDYTAEYFFYEYDEE